MLTSENFSPNNRSKTIGYSLYRISNTKPNGNGKWYICEVYNNGIEWSCYKAYHNNDLQSVIDKFNSITKEKEIIKLMP